MGNILVLLVLLFERKYSAPMSKRMGFCERYVEKYHY